MESSFLTIQCFFRFFSGLYIVQGTFSATLSVSKLYYLSLWIIEHLRPCSINIYGKFYLYCWYHLRLFSGLQILEIWFVYYVLHFGSVKIHKHCLYWSVFSTDLNGKIIFNCFLLSNPFLIVSMVYVLRQ